MVHQAILSFSFRVKNSFLYENYLYLKGTIMKERFNQTRTFVKNHGRSMISGAAGLGIGIAITHHYHLNVYQMKRWGLGITKEQLQEMLDHPTRRICYDLDGIGKFDLSQIDLSKLQ